MKRRLAAGLTSILLLTALVGAIGEPQELAPVEAGALCEQLPPTDLRRICESGKLTVARYGGERPPFFFQTSQGWRGFDIDLARDVARRLGVEYQSHLADSFDEVVELVTSRRADIGISKLSVTLDRSRSVRFSKPYMTVYQTLLINRLAAPKQQDPFSFLNRAAVRIGALGGSSYIGYAETEFAAAEVAAYTDFEGMMTDVTESRLDAAFVDSARANTWRRNNPERLIQVRAFVARDLKDLLAIAVNWEDTHLLSWLDLYLDSIRDDGSAEQLYRRWFVEALPEASP